MTASFPSHANSSFIGYPSIWCYTAVSWGTMLQAGRPRVRFLMRSFDFFFQLTYSFQAHYGPEVGSASNIVPGIYLRVKGSRRLRLELHRHLWSDCLENVGASTSHNPWTSTAYYKDSFTFFCWQYRKLWTEINLGQDSDFPEVLVVFHHRLHYILLQLNSSQFIIQLLSQHSAICILSYSVDP
jgi:hypothetical protein